MEDKYVNSTEETAVKKAEPKRQINKKLLFIIIAVLVVLAVAAPFIYGFAKKNHLRNNPNKYMLYGYNKTDWSKGGIYEVSVEFPRENGLAEDVDEDVLDYVEASKIRLTLSKINNDAKGREPILRALMELVHNDKVILQYSLAASEEAVVMGFFDNLMYIDLKDNSGSSVLSKRRELNMNPELFRKFKRDPEVRKIILQMLSNTTLADKDRGVVEEFSGKKCDLLKSQVGLNQVFKAVSSLAEILDSNNAVRELCDGMLYSYIYYMDELSKDPAVEESMETVSDYDREALAELKKMVDSGAYVSVVKSTFDQINSTAGMIFMILNPTMISDVYISGGDIVRMDNHLSVEMRDMMSGSMKKMMAINFNYRETEFDIGGPVTNEGADVEISVSMSREEMEKKLEEYSKVVDEFLEKNPEINKVMDQIKQFNSEMEAE